MHPSDSIALERTGTLDTINPFNQRYSVPDIGPITHTGKYFGQLPDLLLANGRSKAAVTQSLNDIKTSIMRREFL
jgi:hypothetical protein